MLNVTRKPKAGLLLFATYRFDNIGKDTTNGTYGQRIVHNANIIVDAMSKDNDLVYNGIIRSEEDIRCAIDRFFIEKVDYIFSTNLSWNEDSYWARFLRDMPVIPLLFVVIQKEKLDFDNIHNDEEFTRMLVSTGMIGGMEASGSIEKMHRTMTEVFAGTLDMVVAKAKIFADAAKCRRILLDANFGIMGPLNAVMWSTYVDPYILFREIGPTLHFYTVPQLKNKVDEVSDNDAKHACQEIVDKYDFESDINQKKFLESVRASIALERLCMEEGLDLMSLNDIDFILMSEIGLRPGFMPCVPEDKTVYVPEGDLGGALAAYILHVLSQDRVNFMEPYFVNFDKQAIVVAHGGPNDYTSPAGKCIIGLDVRFAQTTYRYAGAPFAWYVFPEGRTTTLHISQIDDSFKMVTSQVDMLPSEHFLPSYSHGIMRPVSGSPIEWVKRVLEIGVTQHHAIALGDYLNQIRSLSNMLGQILIEI